MNLYFLSQTQNCGYDTYDSMVVAAENEDLAKLIHPASRHSDNVLYDSSVDRWYRAWWKNIDPDYVNYERDWADYSSQVKITFIGTAITGTPAGVICASFNAG